MRLRPVLALAACTALAAGTGVAAAAAPVCNLVTDKAGDTNLYPVGGVTSDALDITSVDVASDKRTVTAVIRVKKLSLTDPKAPTGMTWGATFVVGGVTLGLSGHTGPTGAPLFYASYTDPTTGGSIYAAPVSGTFDLAKNEVRMSAASATFARQATIKAGKTKLTEIGAVTGTEVLIPLPAGPFGNTLFSDSEFPADEATGGKDYLAGTASCVTVGK